MHEARQNATGQRDQLRTTLRSIGDAVIATDLDGRVTSLNPVAEDLTGWTSSEATGKPLDEVFRISNELTGKPAESPVAKVLRDGVVVGLANHTMLTARDGTNRPIDDSAAPRPPMTRSSARRSTASSCRGMPLPSDCSATRRTKPSGSRSS
jgi:PAS domain S-box-containing protein